MIFVYTSARGLQPHGGPRFPSLGGLGGPHGLPPHLLHQDLSGVIGLHLPPGLTREEYLERIKISQVTNSSLGLNFCRLLLHFPHRHRYPPLQYQAEQQSCCWVGANVHLLLRTALRLPPELYR